MSDNYKRHMLDRDLEAELNKNIDFILTNTNRIQEDSSYSIDIPDIGFEAAICELRETANNIASVTNMLAKNYQPESQYSKPEYTDRSVKSSAVLLLCSQIRYLQKLTMAMRLHLDE